VGLYDSLEGKGLNDKTSGDATLLLVNMITASLRGGAVG
jgi:hypothetical protein